MTASSRGHADLSRADLARLVVCDHAARLADAAAWLVSTRHDVDTAAGGRASQAAQIVEYSRRLLATAVIYERERGSSWEDIAHYLDTTPEQAQAEYEPHISEWLAVFEDPAEATATTIQRVSHPYRAVKDPAWVGEVLDAWGRRHLDTKDAHQVTASLTPPDRD